MAAVLSIGDRETILESLAHDRKTPFAEIARRISFDRSTVSREVRANGGREGYSPSGAQQRATEQRCRPKPFRFDDDPALKARVDKLLGDGFSPAGIAVMCRADGLMVCHETIYQALYDQRLAVSPEDCLHLRRRRRRRRRDPGTTNPTGNYLGAFRTIHTRPDHVEDRCEPGHWEGDLIVGAFSHTAMVTLYERMFRLTHLIELPEGKTSRSVVGAIAAWLLTLPEELRRSLTWDRGAELSKWGDIDDQFSLGVYFADPHAPWQRGGNEQNNGILRRFHPKGTSLANPDIAHTLYVINNQPRRSLGWLSPNQAYNQHTVR